MTSIDISTGLALITLICLSALAFKEKNAVIFLLTAGVSLILGLTWYDVYATPIGLTISLILIVYMIVCIIAAIRCLFISHARTTVEGEER